MIDPDDDDELTELIELDATKVAAVQRPANQTPFLLRKSAEQMRTRRAEAALQRVQRISTARAAKALGVSEIPASGPGEAASILLAVTGERGTSRTCSARTAGGSPCGRPVKPGQVACHHHLKKGKKMNKRTLFEKALDDPVKALARLEKAAAQLPARHPVHQQAAQLIMFHRLRGLRGLTKAVTGDQAAAIADATSAARNAVTSPRRPAVSAHDQLAAIVAGTAQSESMHGRQNAQALEAYGSPAASLGQVLKEAEREVIAARGNLAKAELGRDPIALAAAAEDVTRAQLRLHAAATTVPPIPGREV